MFSLSPFRLSAVSVTSLLSEMFLLKRNSRRWTFPLLGVLAVACAGVPQDVTDSKLLATLKATDELYYRGFTATGTDQEVPVLNSEATPVVGMRWKFSMDSRASALEHRAYEVASSVQNPPPEFQGTPTMTMWSVVALGSKKSGQHSVYGNVLERGSAPPVEENRIVGHVMVDAPDSKRFSLLAGLRILWAIGRGYAKHLDEIESVSAAEDGTLSVTAVGYGYARSQPGKWELVIVPEAAHMVRSARFYKRDRSGSIRESPLLEVVTSGIKQFGEVMVPEKISVSEMSGAVEYPVTVDSASLVPDSSFIREAEAALDPPYAVATVYIDFSSGKPVVLKFGVGQLDALPASSTSE